MQLDLLQLDREAKLPNALRLNWIARTKADPMYFVQGKAAWRRFTLFTFLLSVSLLVHVVAFYYMQPPLSSVHAVLTYSMALLLVVVLISWFCIIFGPDPDVDYHADKFLEALEILYVELPPTPEGLVRMGDAEIVKLAEIRLRTLADALKRIEVSNIDLAEQHRVEFKKVHAAFRDLGLVGEKWDEFFEDEEQPVQGVLDDPMLS